MSRAQIVQLDDVLHATAERLRGSLWVPGGSLVGRKATYRPAAPS